MSIPLPVTTLHVGLDFGTHQHHVGRLALLDGRIYFAFDENFLTTGLEISPLMLPLKAGVTVFEPSPFEGLAGVFDDSLPDGWGRLLYDRWLLSQGRSFGSITPLDRLAHVGTHGLGALTYEPEAPFLEPTATPMLDDLATEALQVLDGQPSEILETLLHLAGSSAGARPKALISVSADMKHIGYGESETKGEPWLVKFPTAHDGLDAGAIEYVYALMAKQSGVAMEATHLFESTRGPGYFATRRFDRNGVYRYHIHTVSGLLHADFRTPALDYRDLLALAFRVTQDIREVEKLYRMAVFNVLAHNRDDHAKNMSFVMNHHGQWLLAPAYDLTFSYGPGGEQSTMVMGEGRSPQEEHLIALGAEAKLSAKTMHEIIDQTRTALAQWPRLATQYGVLAERREFIARKLTL